MRKGESALKKYFNDISFDEIKNEYEFDIMDLCETNVLSVVSNLPEHDRNILILYAELESIQKVADIFKCSKSTIWNKLNKIKSKIKNEIVSY